LDIAPTISYFLGVEPPRESVGQVLLTPGVVGVGPRGPLAVIIPAHNEAVNLPAVLRAIPRGLVPDMKVMVVDDGSTDDTAEVAYRHGADLVVHHETNRGLGAALRTGLETARRMNARAAVYLDADGEYDPREIPTLLRPIEEGKADYVLGSRYRGKRHGGQKPSRFFANLVFTLGLCVLSGRLITDGQTGFRAFSRRALETAEIIHDYNYAQVLTLDLLKKGMKLAEVPISYRRRSRGRSFISGKYLWRVPAGVLREIFSE
jgi:glycosyltransferase involved in cell wall biosynthesis